MGKKDFNKGMVAGAKPFEEKFRMQAEAIKRVANSLHSRLDGIDRVNDAIIDDITSIEKKRLYDLNTAVDISELDSTEKEFLMALIYTVSSRSNFTSDYQKYFVLSIKNYLNVKSPQTEVDISSIENIENLKSQKAILQTLMEFWFLENGSHSYLEEYADVISYFSINKRGIEDILSKIDNIYNATGLMGVAENYGYIPLESGYVDNSTNFEKIELDSQNQIYPSVAFGPDYAIGLRTDGSVVSFGNNKYGQCDVDSWTDIVAVSADFGYTVGLRADGTVIATGCNYSDQCDVDNWTDIVAISTRNTRTVGLRADGTVIATGDNDEGQCDVDNWTDIVAISTGEYHTVGLRADGTVIATGDSDEGQCDVDNWTDIVAISTGDCHTVGLRADGTVIATGDSALNLDAWYDIVRIYTNSYDTFGVRKNGSILVSNNTDLAKPIPNNLTDFVGIFANSEYLIALKQDGNAIKFSLKGKSSINWSLGNNNAIVEWSSKDWSNILVKYLHE